MIPKLTLPFLLLLGWLPGLAAQADLRADLPFFQRKAQTFDRWLVKRQLGELLRVGEVRLDPTGRRVELLLRLQTPETGRAVALWEAMRRSYVPVPGRPTLEDNLFATFRRFFEVAPAQASLQVGTLPSPATGLVNPCFHLWVEAPDGQLRTRNRLESCKSAFLNVTLDLPPICLNPTATANLSGGGASEWVFENVLAFARRKYIRQKAHCEDRFPQLMTVSQTANALEFHVTDLCQEVLTHERQSLWCNIVEWLGGSCNDTRRERLEFRVYFSQPTTDTYQVSIELTGKFGSGLYRPRLSGWMDMDPDFEDDFLIPHARNFEHELVAYLTRP